MHRLSPRRNALIATVVALALAAGILGAVLVSAGATNSPPLAVISQERARLRSVQSSSVQPGILLARRTVTVGQTISITDLEFPVIHPADAAPAPTDWASRVRFKGCGQTVSVRVRAGKKLLLYNGGSVNRYVRNTGGVPLPPNMARRMVPRDWRVVTFNQTGPKAITFTTATCTLWSPKIIVDVVSAS